MVNAKKKTREGAVYLGKREDRPCLQAYLALLNATPNRYEQLNRTARGRKLEKV